MSKNKKVVNRDFDLLAKYCIEVSNVNAADQDTVLYDLERTTYLKTLAPQMISGPLQGKLLTFLCQMMNAKTAVEVGTFTGYSSICIARGLQENGTLHTIEVNKELAFISQEYFEKSGMMGKISQHWGDAKTVIPSLGLEEVDFIFLDGAKSDYPELFDDCVEMLRSGGILLADNVLWSGKVAYGHDDRMTKLIHEFNKRVQEDERVEVVVLPFRDGLSIVRKV